MMALGDSLALLHDATRRYQSLAGEVRHWQDSALKREAVDRYIAGGGPPSTPRPQDDEPTWEVGSRLVVSLPDRLREERTVTAGAASGWGISLLVVDGERWWVHMPRYGGFESTGRPNGGVYTLTHVAPLLDPREVAARVDLEVVGTATVAGRPGIRLRGTARPPVTPPTVSGGVDLWAWGATSHHLVVDADRGVILRTAALLGDDEFDVVEFLSIDFGVEPAPDAFVFVAPDGEPVRHLPEPRPLTPEECRHIGVFTVWFPASPDKVRHLRWQEPWDRDGKPKVYLRSYLEQGYVELEQSQASPQLLVDPRHHTLDVHGTRAHLWQDQAAYSCLAWVMSGTELRLRGNVDSDTIVAFASELRPASEAMG